MWTCSQCGESHGEQFGACWNCNAPRPEHGRDEVGHEADFNAEEPDVVVTAENRVLYPSDAPPRGEDEFEEIQRNAGCLFLYITGAVFFWALAIVLHIIVGLSLLITFVFLVVMLLRQIGIGR